jgi:hypothetical protein
MHPTKQKLAQDIYQWFIVDKNPRSTDDTMGVSCMYRGPTEKHRCGVGCVMPDEIYNPRMEGKTIGQLMTMNHGDLSKSSKFELAVFDYFGKSNMAFLISCQYWHDAGPDDDGNYLSKESLLAAFQQHSIDTSNMPLLTQ